MTKIETFSPLETKLKQADPEIQQYILQLQAKVLKLEQQNLNLKRQNMTFKNRIKVLKRNSEKWSQPKKEKGGEINLIVIPHKKTS